VTESENPPPTDRQSPDTEISPCCQAMVDRRGNQPDVCTIYVAVTGETASEQWISAIGDAFVSREDAR